MSRLEIDWYDSKSPPTLLLYEDKNWRLMSTADKATKLVTESLIYKIETCDRLLKKVDEVGRFGDLFQTRLHLLSKPEELVLRT